MCDCCNNETATGGEGEVGASSEIAQRIFRVEGMTCGHCKASVTEEVSQVPGVVSVEVDVATGQLTVTGDVSDHDIKAAVEEAGYRVVA